MHDGKREMWQKLTAEEIGSDLFPLAAQTLLLQKDQVLHQQRDGRNTAHASEVDHRGAKVLVVSVHQHLVDRKAAGGMQLRDQLLRIIEGRRRRTAKAHVRSTGQIVARLLLRSHTRLDSVQAAAVIDQLDGQHQRGERRERPASVRGCAHGAGHALVGHLTGVGQRHALRLQPNVQRRERDRGTHAHHVVLQLTAAGAAHHRATVRRLDCVQRRLIFLGRQEASTRLGGDHAPGTGAQMRGHVGAAADEGQVKRMLGAGAGRVLGGQLSLSLLQLEQPLGDALTVLGHAVPFLGLNVVVQLRKVHAQHPHLIVGRTGTQTIEVREGVSCTHTHHRLLLACGLTHLLAHLVGRARLCHAYSARLRNVPRLARETFLADNPLWRWPLLRNLNASATHVLAC
mmetsp:Transcript_12306/g.37255  ORF Transcript_12306/g.37255 Transcript_12306/m.37255 type:complete len:400 (+) Transcript_12306:1315-2514(+)